MSTWLITGCSSGLGRAFAEEALFRGNDVVVTARDAAKVEDLAKQYPDTALAQSLDVTDADQVAQVVKAAEERFGGIDVLINNAGYGYRSAVEEGVDEDVEQLFDTHFFGTVRTVKAVLPGMRQRRSGTIVNLSSIGARGIPAGSGYYSAVKAAVETMTTALHKELEPLGIHAFTVGPGAFRTDFSGRSLTQSPNPIADYADTAGKRRIENDTQDGTQPGDPKKGAKALVDVIESGHPPVLLVLGSDAVEGVRTALKTLADDVDAWESTSRSTDFDA